MDNFSDKPSLQIHEWLAVVCIIGLLGFLTALSWFNATYSSAPETGTPHYILAQEIEINIQGAVEQPGRRLVKKGITVGEALAHAGLLSDADLRRVKLDSKVRRNQTIKVPQLATITVIVEGAVVTPGSLKLPKGAKLMDLIAHVVLQDNADVEKLRKKRRLKDGETIQVPKKD